MTTWFKDLFGFVEAGYDETRAAFEVDQTQLISKVNGRRFGIGTFDTPTLGSLRHAGAQTPSGRLTVGHHAIGDVLELHAVPEHAGAMFQVASQLNCLEFADPRETPEDGVTNYAYDATQGPACSLAAAAATVYRNYFAPVGDDEGQRADRQLNNLAAVQALLDEDVVRVKNGYCFSNPDAITALSNAVDPSNRDLLLDAMRIGVQTDVEVTFARRYEEPVRPQNVSQSFCSALSCGYDSGPLAAWEGLARVVLEAAYEATLWAAALDAHEGRGSGIVWLTFIGGGAFGNRKAWIGESIGRALNAVADRPLDVRIAHFRRIDIEMQRTIDSETRGSV